MTFFKYPAILISCCFLFFNCQDNKRAQELTLREQRILQRENDFALKEADYQSLLKMRDSLLTQTDDTTATVLQTWPEEIAGLWNGRSLCRESNCQEYVVGDQRSNTWEFVSDSTGLHTRVINNNQVIRVYQARFDSTRIWLEFKSDSASTKNVALSVELDRSNPNLLKGTQNIGVDQACTAKFTLDLTRLNR